MVFYYITHHTKNPSDTKHEDINVKRTESHKEYDGLSNDIAMLYLEKDVTYRGESKNEILLKL